MDKRFVIEFIPGIAFIVGNAIGGIFFGAGLACIATVIAIALRWRWDKTLPWMAISIFVLTVVFLVAGLVFDYTTFVKVSGTIGSVAFAGIVALGALLRPSLLRRTLGYKLEMSDAGWRALHVAWIGVSLARAAANEAVWRNSSDDVWAIYNGFADFAWFGLFFAVTWLVAHRYWNGPDEQPVQTQ